MPVTDDASKAQTKAPIIVDLGKKRRKLVKRLRGGTGKLMDQVNETLQELKNAGTIGATAQPVIVVVRERRGSSARNLLWP
jgi:soluble P-type ATPase